MSWIPFHHPDISLPVVRRRVGIEILEMLEMTSLFLTRGGWGLMKQSCYPNQAAYQNAASRLRRNGLIVTRSEGGRSPQLFLSDAGKGVLPDYFSPERLWNRRWNDIWYMLIYDVPEVDRKYRDVLRQFLRRLHMGCLQQSVWVTPEDIRPDFNDLEIAVNIDAFAYLFEARTVLGLSAREVVEDAWNFDRILFRQEHYCQVMQRNLARLNDGAFSQDELAALMRVALDAYHGAFDEDPLLPNALLPANYLGKEVLALHRSVFFQIDRQLQNMSFK
jgi:phenylacetic acid degradation operon negative regulatory protein